MAMTSFHHSRIGGRGLDFVSSKHSRPTRSTPTARLSFFLASLALPACTNTDPSQVLPTIEITTKPHTTSSMPPTGGVATERPREGTQRSEEVDPRTGTTSSEEKSSFTPSSSSSAKTGASSSATSTGGTSSHPTDSRSTGSTSDSTSSDRSTASGNDSTGSSGSTQPDKDSGTGTDNPEDRTCLPLCEKGTRDAFVDCVVDFNPAPETVHYTEEYEVTDPETGKTVTKIREYHGWNHDKMPDIVLGPPKGVFDTVSLGCEGSLTVGFVDPPLTDGPGPDLIVFENPFAPIFPEPVKVEVSDDACTWHEFPCNPITLEGCGGVSVVKALPGKGLDPTDPKVAGGDSFDLADVGIARARFVRVTCVSREYWLAKENTEKWCDPGPMTTGKGGSDIDAFAFVHGPVEPPQ